MRHTENTYRVSLFHAFTYQLSCYSITALMLLSTIVAFNSQERYVYALLVGTQGIQILFESSFQQLFIRAIPHAESKHHQDTSENCLDKPAYFGSTNENVKRLEDFQDVTTAVLCFATVALYSVVANIYKMDSTILTFGLYSLFILGMIYQRYMHTRYSLADKQAEYYSIINTVNGLTLVAFIIIWQNTNIYSLQTACLILAISSIFASVILFLYASNKYIKAPHMSINATMTNVTMYQSIKIKILSSFVIATYYSHDLLRLTITSFSGFVFSRMSIFAFAGLGNYTDSANLAIVLQVLSSIQTLALVPVSANLHNLSLFFSRRVPSKSKWALDLLFLPIKIFCACTAIGFILLIILRTYSPVVYPQAYNLLNSIFSPSFLPILIITVSTSMLETNHVSACNIITTSMDFSLHKRCISALVIYSLLLFAFHLFNTLTPVSICLSIFLSQLMVNSIYWPTRAVKLIQTVY